MRNLLCQPRTKLVALLAFVLLITLHPFLLPIATWHIIHTDEPVNGATHLLFLRSARSSQSAFDFAASFAETNPDHRVVVIRDYVRRAEAIGAEAPFLETTIEMLQDQGVSTEQIELIGDGVAMTTGEQLRFASEWLQLQPTKLDVLVATKTFDSGYVKFAANSSMTKETISQLHLLAFDRAGVNASNWWKSALGLKDFIRSNLRLIHLLLIGDQRPTIDWDPDAYEASLRALRELDA